MTNPDKLPYKKFLESFKVVPRVAICLLIKDNSGAVLLSKRTVQPLNGYWHIPGSFLLKGEKLLDCLKRVGIEELSLNIKSENAKLLGVFDDLDKDPRGHVIDVIYGYNFKGKLKSNDQKIREISFFRKMPANIGFNHDKILLYLSKQKVS